MINAIAFIGSNNNQSTTFMYDELPAPKVKKRK